MPPRAKRTEYGVTVEHGGRALADGEAPLELDETWTPEHLVLLALARCSLASLDYHTRRLSIQADAAAVANGAVSAREDGSWGMLDLECRIEARFEPALASAPLRGLLKRTEAGCFVGTSLTPKPRYHWTVNGAEIA